jgi:hypothetical protein
MKLVKVAGATSEIWQLFIQSTAAFDGSGLTGLTSGSSGLTAYYHRDTDTTATVINLTSMTVGTFTSSGFAAVDGTNLPGVYQFCPPNAALASGAKSCVFMLKGAANMAVVVIEVQLTAVNPDSATAFVTGINSLAPPTNWNTMAIDSSGRVDLGKWVGNAPDALSSGKVPTDVKLWLTAAPNALQSGRVDSYLGAVASGVIAAASFASGALDAVWSTTSRTLSTGAIVAGTFAANALDAVWSTTTRLLSAGTNIVLAKGTGVTGFTDLDAAGVRSAVGLASANLDTQLGALPTTTTVNAIKAKTDLIPASPAAVGDIPTANANADALLDRTDAVETGLTVRKALRLMGAALGGKCSGAASNAPVYRNAVADSKARITATTDGDGDRTAVTLDLT